VTPEQWQIIAEIAKDLGILDHTIRQWRSRNKVPYHMQIEIMMRSSGRIRYKDFAKHNNRNKVA
jgi:transposase-like protein